MTCRYDADLEDYVHDGEFCRHDDYGDPTKHCTARKTCAQHVGWGELTCARCLNRTRMDIWRIVQDAALMLPEAVKVGLGEAAWMAAPGVDPRAWSERRFAAISHLEHWWHAGRIKERQHDYARETIDDDEHHPYNVLTRWHLMLAEDYGLQLPPKMTIADSADFLTRVLHRVAQDDEQDFPLLAREIRKCRTHLENVRRDSQQPEKGEPCPDCKAADAAKRLRDPSYKGRLERLVREYPHWCEDEDCERIHHVTDEADMWRCPRNPAHVWTMEAYSNYVEERKVGA